jgi:hypothetical protein
MRNRHRALAKRDDNRGNDTSPLIGGPLRAKLL